MKHYLIFTTDADAQFLHYEEFDTEESIIDALNLKTEAHPHFQFLIFKGRQVYADGFDSQFTQKKRYTRIVRDQ